MTTETNRPTHNLYIVTQDDNGESQWVEIGAAWANKDNKGFSFKFKLYPRTGDQVVMRARTEKEG